MSNEQEIDALRDDIEQTREEMGQTIEHLQERLAPKRLQEDAGAIVQEVADRVIAEIQAKTGDLTAGLSLQIQAAVHGAATAKSEELFTQAAASARTAGASLWRRATQNPAPVALAAVAVGLLAAGGRTTVAASQTGPPEATGNGDGLRAQASSAIGRATDAASALGQQAGELVGQAKDAAKGGMGTNGGSLHAEIGNQPLLAGLVALGIGMAVGLTLPETDAERETMSPLRDQVQHRLDDASIAMHPGDLVDQAKAQVSSLIDHAKAAVSDGAAQAKNAATDVVGSAKQAATTAADDRGLTR